MGCCGGKKKENTVKTSAKVVTNALEKSGDEIPYGSSRQSCLECVEKHLGSAWTLYSEYKIGYPYRMLVIGHLHEAETESEAWPSLSLLIRENRKRFQVANQIPCFDFMSLKLLETIQFLIN